MHPIKLLHGLAGWIVVAWGAAMLLAAPGYAATPRWVTGWPYFQNNNGNPVAWFTNQPLYYTDPGDLSAYVNHAAADAMVASAASAWNNSMSAMTLAQGGALNEHVSSANVYLGSSGPVFPADVQASNSAAKQIAVIYDTDGSVTDTLLGGGASDPSSCRQNAVTESVDSIATNGQIQHALIVLNGRCTGAGTAPQLEMKYRLVRAFGRVLGLGWSQLNDNVFTGVPYPTAQQSQNWPLMHPIDVLCGPYAYQCMVNPFSPRTDDLAALIAMYPVYTAGNGKTQSYTNAAKVFGFVSFPNGQGMQGLLVSLRRFHFGPGYSDAYDLTSAVTGQSFQQVGGNPVTPKGSALAQSLGSTNTYYEGYYNMGWVPVPTTDYFDNFTVTTSAINPLYTGQYAVGPYAVSQVTPFGPAMTNTAYVVNTLYGAQLDMTSTNVSSPQAATAQAGCGAGTDGRENAPATVDASGSWSGALCSYQHTAWSSLQMKAGRSLTMEVTATDEQGYATTGKMLPVIGVWDSGDATGLAPTLASQAVGLNASTLGMTNILVATGTARRVRIGLGDQRGDGRPDYMYNARVLYADTVSPASLPANGGTVTISGMGFKPGNTVTVNGVAATVTNWTATAITLVAPPIAGAVAADVVVRDLSTGGQTTMTGALAYSGMAQPDVLTVVSKPANGGYAGSVGSPVFKVQVMLPDGVTPAGGLTVMLSSGGAAFGACSGASTCALTADASGYVSSAVTPTSAGTVTLTAAGGGGTVSTAFVALAVPVDQLTVLSLPSGTVYATLPAATPFRVQVMLPDGTTPAAGAPVVMTATNAGLGGCSGAPACTMVADVSGRIMTTVTPAAAGLVSLLATAGGGMVSASFGATALPADILRAVSKPADGSYVGRAATLPFTVQVMLGDNATPATSAAVTVSASGATLTACGATTCVLTADSTGTVSTTVSSTTAGTVGLTASAGGGTLSVSYTAAAIPADTLTVVTKPASGSYVGRVASTPFAVHVVDGETGSTAAGVSVTVSASGATLAACGGATTCVLTADSGGGISTTVTPSVAGTVTLTATAGGGTVSTTFTAAAVPPDGLSVVTKPADGSYAGRVATIPFAVQVALGDTGLPANGVSVMVTASNATLGCGAATCTLVADATGSVSTTVTPSAAGTVLLTASAGGGTVSASFTAATVPPDALTVVTKPANGSYVGRAAAIPFAVQVALGDTGLPAVGVSVSVSVTNGVLGACGAATCTLTANASGTISTTVTPSAVGVVGLSASAGGGTVSASFTAAAVPPDALTVVTKPANGSYVGRAAAIPFAVQVALGDTGLPAAGVSVAVSATNAVLGACGLATCTLTADATGTVSTMVTPSSAGTVSLTASAGGGTVSASFNAVPVPPDALTVVTKPADGSYVARAAVIPFAVHVALGDTGLPAVGVSVTLLATNATLGACGASTCVLTADATGAISTSVTPSTAGAVGLTANAGGGTAFATFNAVPVPPDTLHVVAKPANGSYVGAPAAIPFSVETLLGDTGGPAIGASVTVTATNATLGCGVATCALVANLSGIVSTTVTPTAAGTVTLSASAGGGTVATSFTAAPMPPDTLQVVTVPANGSYAGSPAVLPFSVSILLGDGVTAASGAAVTVTATGATLGACGLSTCTMTATTLGTISTSVTALAPGTVTLTAAAGGGMVSSSFTAQNPPATLEVISAPPDSSYVGRAATVLWVVKVFLGTATNAHLSGMSGVRARTLSGFVPLGVVGTPASGETVTLTAIGATLGACGLPACVLTADSAGTVSTTVTPLVPGPVALLASAGGGTVTSNFNAATPPDVVSVTSTPANGSFANRVAAAPFAVQVLLGDGTTPAAGVPVTLTVTGAMLNVCGLASCTVTASSSGVASSPVTPTVPGVVTLSASAGGGTANGSFTAAALPPDTLQILSQPANGSYAQRVAALPFRVQVLLGDTGGPASGLSVTLSAANATLGACGLASCIVTTDASGIVFTTVTPSAAGAVSLTAQGGGGIVSATFSAAAIPPDTLHVVSQPANGAYVSRTAAVPFQVQIALGDTGGAAAGVSVTLTAVGASLGACGAPMCVLTADAAGTVSTTVTPSAPGMVQLTATAGGGAVSTSFAAIALPPDMLLVTSAPSSPSYVGAAASTPFAVHVLLGDGTTPASGAAVTMTAFGATVGSCGGSVCVLTANGMGDVSTTIMALNPGTITLTASAGGGSVSVSFTAAADVLRVVTSPANGSYTNSVTALPYAVQVLLGDGVTVSPGVSVVVTASSGALLEACGLSACVLTSDAQGIISTLVTATAPGLVNLTASGAGGSAGASFTAVVPPNVLQIVSSPADGTMAGRAAATLFAVRVTQGFAANQSLRPMAAIGNPPNPISGVAVTLSAAGATLDACGLATCVLTSDITGLVSSAVTPAGAGPVTLSASAGGVTASAGFMAASAPDVLRAVSVPANGSYTGRVAAAPFVVQVFAPDGVTPVTGTSVTLAASGATLGLCGSGGCVLITDGMGRVSTTVTPGISGVISLSASAGGGGVAASFTAATPPDILRVASLPANGAYTGHPAALPFSVQVLLGDGATPAVGTVVTLSSGSAMLGACGQSSCSITADASGMVSTSVVPTAAGTVSLFASADGGSASASFIAVDPVRTLAVSRLTEYVAVGATVMWTPSVTVLENGLPIAGTAVTWTTTAPGLTLTSSSTTVDASGIASVGATIGPLAAGASIVGQVCAWSTVCTTFQVQAVDPSLWRIALVSGAPQNVAATGSLQALLVRVVDEAGDWIAGAPIDIYQIIRGWAACPPTGRCPVGPMLGNSSSVVVSDADGIAPIQPLETQGSAETTEIVAAAGPNGYVSVSLTKAP